MWDWRVSTELCFRGCETTLTSCDKKSSEALVWSQGRKSDTASGYQFQIWTHWPEVTYGELSDLQQDETQDRGGFFTSGCTSRVMLKEQQKKPRKAPSTTWPSHKKGPGAECKTPREGGMLCYRQPLSSIQYRMTMTWRCLPASCWLAFVKVPDLSANA